MKSLIILITLISLNAKADRKTDLTSMAIIDALMVANDESIDPITKQPRNEYEMDYFEKCEFLQKTISKEKGFKVVLPACVALGHQKYE